LALSRRVLHFAYGSAFGLFGVVVALRFGLLPFEADAIHHD
jgi:hypothetical protein